MARCPQGYEIIDSARAQLAKVTDANALRVLLAVVLPLCHRLSIKATAEVVGRSSRWVTMARNAYIRRGGLEDGKAKTRRNHANMSKQEEVEFLAPFWESAQCGGVLVVSAIHRALETRLGRKVAPASAYNLLHRHGWRKLAPDKRNIAADIQTQENWKKNSRKSSRQSTQTGTGPVDSD